MRRDQKSLPFSSLFEISQAERKKGNVVVHCHGVFDLLHPGHFRHLAAARAQGDILIVTITSDRFVGKGPGRPVFTQELRVESLASLEFVDFVAVIDDPSAIPALEAIKPDFFVKGSEYAQEKDDPTGKITEERQLVEKLGGRVTYTEELVFSSSELINSFLPRHSPEVQSWLRFLRDEFGTDIILNWIDCLSNVEVLVIGETILDVYTECETLGRASKEPTLCLNRRESTTHAGGALAVAAHCKGLGARVTLITGLNVAADGRDPILKKLESDGIDLHLIDIAPRPTIRKERLIDSITRSRVIEIYEMDDSPLGEPTNHQLVSTLESTLSNGQMTLIADYGHGLLTEQLIEAITAQSQFLAVNSQTNAGNHGFNSVRRYPSATFVTLNGQEARLEARRRHVDFATFVPRLREELSADGVLVTMGGAGLDLHLSDGTVVQSPALAPFVVDRVGAGDAVLAITSMLTYIGAPPPIVGFLGNLAGAWSVTFLGNEQSLTAGTIKRQVLSMLK